MTITANRAIKKNLGSPDKVRELSNAKLESVNLDDATLTRIRLQPGWKWSQDMGPAMGAETCHSSHIQYVISGRLLIAMDDGTKLELGPGDFAEIPPGHDAWVLGDEPFVAVDFSPAMKEYVK